MEAGIQMQTKLNLKVLPIGGAKCVEWSQPVTSGPARGAHAAPTLPSLAFCSHLYTSFHVSVISLCEF